MGSHHLYFGACDEQGGIEHYLWNNGEIKYAEKTPMPYPMYIDAEGSKLHILLEKPFQGSVNSGLVTYEIEPNGQIRQSTNIIDTMEQCACHLCHHHGHEYVVNYQSGNVFSTAGKVDRHKGHGIHPTRQEAPHSHYIHQTPDGQYLMCCDLGLDTVFLYDDRLNVVSTAKVPEGHGCRHLIASDDGQYVFCANELASTVTVFAYRDGHLEPMETVDALPKNHPKNTASAIRFHHNLVYVSQRGCDTISVFRWKGKHLQLLGNSPCGGSSPRDFMVLDNHLMVTNEKSDAFSILSIAGDSFADTGIRLQMKSPLCVVAVPMEGCAD